MATRGLVVPALGCAVVIAVSCWLLSDPPQRVPAAGAPGPQAALPAVRVAPPQLGVATARPAVPAPGRAAVQRPDEVWRDLQAADERDLVDKAVQAYHAGGGIFVDKALEQALQTRPTSAATAYALAGLLAAGGRDLGYLQWLAQTLSANLQAREPGQPEALARQQAYEALIDAVARASPDLGLQLCDSALVELPGALGLLRKRAELLEAQGYLADAAQSLASLQGQITGGKAATAEEQGALAAQQASLLGRMALAAAGPTGAAGPAQPAGQAAPAPAGAAP